MGHLMIWKAGEVIWRVQWGQETCFGVIGGRWGGPGGPRGSRGAFRGSHGAIRLVWWVFRWFMRHIHLYIYDPNFSCGLTNGRTEVFHEALADLKSRHKRMQRRRANGKYWLREIDYNANIGKMQAQEKRCRHRGKNADTTGKKQAQENAKKKSI